MNNELINLPTPSSTGWTAILIAAAVFLVLVAVLARLGMLAIRRMIVLSLIGALALGGSLIGQTVDRGESSRIELASVNEQLAQAWPQIARVNGGLLDSAPTAGQHTIWYHGVPCELTLSPAGDHHMNARMACGGTDVAPSTGH